MTRQLRALRGATTIDADTEEQVLERTENLVRELLKRNDLQPSDLVSMIFTATSDIHAEFPARAARNLGIVDIALMCMREMEVPHGLPLCIRVLVHFYTDKEPSELRPVYLEGAVGLRTDLMQ